MLFQVFLPATANAGPGVSRIAGATDKAVQRVLLVLRRDSAPSAHAAHNRASILPRLQPTCMRNSEELNLCFWLGGAPLVPAIHTPRYQYPAGWTTTAFAPTLTAVSPSSSAVYQGRDLPIGVYPVRFVRRSGEVGPMSGLRAAHRSDCMACRWHGT